MNKIFKNVNPVLESLIKGQDTYDEDYPTISIVDAIEVAKSYTKHYLNQININLLVLETGVGNYHESISNIKELLKELK